MTEGTVAEVVERAGLVTYRISDANQPEMAAKLRASTAITQAVAFGTRLHVSGHDAHAIEAVLREVLGTEREGQVIVKDGLSGGETLVERPTDGLKDGDSVRVRG